MSASIWASTSSSSTTRIRALPVSTGPAPAPAPRAARRTPADARVTVVPTFSRLSIRTRPPWRDTMPYTTDRPSPVPRAPLVVKNGIEGAPAHLGGHPDAGVPDEALDRLAEPASPRSSPGSSERTPRVSGPAARHRVDGVQQEVQEHLAQLRRVAADRRHRLERERHVDERAARLRLVLPARTSDLHDLLQQRRDLDRLRLLLALGAREPQDPAHRLRPVQGRPLDDLEALHDQRVGCPPLEELRPPEDGGEEVVEVVGDAARHLPQGSELGRLDRLLLRGLELRVGGPEVGVQLRVADGDRRLLRHRAGEPDLLGAELVLLPDADPEDAPDVLAEDDRGGQHRADPLGLEQGQRVAAPAEARIGRQVRRPHRRAHQRRVAGGLVAGLQDEGRSRDRRTGRGRADSEACRRRAGGCSRHPRPSPRTRARPRDPARGRDPASRSRTVRSPPAPRRGARCRSASASSACVWLKRRAFWMAVPTSRPMLPRRRSSVSLKSELPVADQDDRAERLALRQDRDQEDAAYRRALGDALPVRSDLGGLVQEQGLAGTERLAAVALAHAQAESGWPRSSAGGRGARRGPDCRASRRAAGWRPPRSRTAPAAGRGWPRGSPAGPARCAPPG